MVEVVNTPYPGMGVTKKVIFLKRFSSFFPSMYLSLVVPGSCHFAPSSPPDTFQSLISLTSYIFHHILGLPLAGPWYASCIVWWSLDIRNPEEVHNYFNNYLELGNICGNNFFLNKIGAT